MYLPFEQQGGEVALLCCHADADGRVARESHLVLRAVVVHVDDAGLARKRTRLEIEYN